MTGMKMAGSDLRGAVIWMAQPPVWDTTGLSDLSELAVRAPDEAERAAMKASMERISDDEVRRRAIEMVGSLAEKDTTWAGSIDQQRWQSWSKTTDEVRGTTALFRSPGLADGHTLRHVSNRGTVEQYARALADQDLDAQDAVIHDDYIGRYPQSGEIIRGRANYRAIGERYPGAEGGHLPVTPGSIVGRDDEFITGPSWNLIHLAGSGDDFTLTGTITYPNGEVWHAVGLLTLRDGKIWREANYFAPPFERPEWRAAITELEPAGTEPG